MWSLVPGTAGYVSIKNVNSGLCVAMGAGSTEQGHIAIQWGCEGVSHKEQQWKVTTRAVGARVVNQFSKLCLSNNGVETNGAHLVQTTCNDANDAEFHLTARAGGYAELADDRSHLCLAIGGASTAEGAAAIQWNCNGVNAGEQMWSIYTGTTGTTHLRNKSTGKCLDIGDGSKTVGAALTQQTCSETDTGQSWQPVDN
jgi:hypothetical protein